MSHRSQICCFKNRLKNYDAQEVLIFGQIPIYLVSLKIFLYDCKPKKDFIFSKRDLEDFSSGFLKMLTAKLSLNAVLQERIFRDLAEVLLDLGWKILGFLSGKGIKLIGLFK